MLHFFREPARASLRGWLFLIALRASPLYFGFAQSLLAFFRAGRPAQRPRTSPPRPAKA
jgi:hypothetical protein